MSRSVPDEPPRGIPWRSLFAFAAVFFLLQAAYEGSRGTWFERLIVHVLTLEPAAWLVNIVAPGADAVARGASIVGPTTRLNIVAGCEGVEVMLLFAAAIVAVARGWRVSLVGLAIGLAVIHVANLVRVAGLFLAARHDRELFALLHGYVAPVLMIAVAVVVFNAWLARRQLPAGS